MCCVYKKQNAVGGQGSSTSLSYSDSPCSSSRLSSCSKFSSELGPSRVKSTPVPDIIRLISSSRGRCIRLQISLYRLIHFLKYQACIWATPPWMPKLSVTVITYIYQHAPLVDIKSYSYCSFAAVSRNFHEVVK